MAWAAFPSCVLREGSWSLLCFPGCLPAPASESSAVWPSWAVFGLLQSSLTLETAQRGPHIILLWCCCPGPSSECRAGGTHVLLLL